MQADYSMVMPFLVKALLDNRARYAAMTAEEQAAANRRRRATFARGGYRLLRKPRGLL